MWLQVGGGRLVRLTNIHQVVVDTFHRDHLQEVVLVVSLLGHLGAVGVVFEEVVEELGEERSHLSRPRRLTGFNTLGSVVNLDEPRTPC